MFILGIESSCDETAFSIIERGEKNSVIVEKIKSQIDLHKKFGGVVPEIASRSHYEVLTELMNGVINRSGLEIDDIGLISVTNGPGLIGSLLIGLSFAKGLSYSYKIPLIGVNHILSHAESPFITGGDDIEYPLLSLVVSGGHTTLFYFKTKFDFEIVSATRDDAAGEVMDKVAKFLGLGYPGGPILDKLYEKGDPERFQFTIPKMSDGSDDFSFSGYKTAVLRRAASEGITKENKDMYDLISSFLNSVTDYLILKIRSGLNKFEVKSITVAGGVSKNSLLRKKLGVFSKEKNIPLYLPDSKYCTDNASMVAWMGYERFKTFPENDYENLYLDAYARKDFNTLI
jgi:N6-L-threonylcarbamoyladenine synthase